MNILPVNELAVHELLSDLERDQYGFLKNEFEIVADQIQRNESLYVILDRHGLTPQEIYAVQRAASEKANLNHMIPGQDYKVYKKDGTASGMVWKFNALEYLVMSWSNDMEEVDITRGVNDLITREKVATGVIQHSLYESLNNQGLSQVLGIELANIFAWEINFFGLQRGDNFKVIYEEQYVGDEFYQIGSVKAAEFEHRGALYKAYYFENEDQKGYFDEGGNSLQKALLQAPFRYNQRISSGFSHNRFHPILQVNRPHYGIDYAAPTGTPIIAVGDGVITEARYRGGNGNIVQIRHNSVYSTAYLHLNRFASGIRAGTRIQQGQVIGYVGQTGLATGPHLCYRLYVNGNPVNSRTIDLPASEALKQEYLTEFNYHRSVLDQFFYEISSGNPFASINNGASGGGRN